jgi:hypothetical protein
VCSLEFNAQLERIFSVNLSDGNIHHVSDAIGGSA